MCTFFRWSAIDAGRLEGRRRKELAEESAVEDFESADRFGKEPDFDWRGNFDIACFAECMRRNSCFG